MIERFVRKLNDIDSMGSISILPKSRRHTPLKKGAAGKIPLEYGKTEVQTLFEPLQRFH